MRSADDTPAPLRPESEAEETTMMRRGADARGVQRPELTKLIDPFRLQALDEVELLGPAVAESLNRLAGLASLSLQARVAMIGLVDAKRHRILAEVGLPTEIAASCEIPFGASICRHAVESDRPLLIEDARVHPLIVDNPSVIDLGIVGYAGIPLVTGDGHALGSLCVVDDKPRAWSEREVAILQGLAAQAMTEIEARAAEAAERRRADDVTRRADEHADRLRLLSDALEGSQARLRSSQEELVTRLARAIELRSEETGDHIRRMSAMCGLLARSLGMSDAQGALIVSASRLHDIGKIAIPDSILNKPGALTAEERVIIETHAEVGHDMLAGAGDPVLDMAAVIALTHHERFDGGGYPTGLRGAEIPLEGRIAAVADVFDALTNDRSYRAAMPVEDALALMATGAGTQFDLPVLEALSDLVAAPVPHAGGSPAEPLT